ncbi:MAG: peptide-methionine (S)-S-oxide reductase MsrA [Anaerolineae bacterium]|nr:peptide-methionine (S)-S-oxide reductase MsrA [Phycisphaerae bacterium]
MRPIQLLPLLLAMLISCSTAAPGGHDVPKPAVDWPAKDGETSRSIVISAGCFWCVEATFEQLNGVTDVTSGYAGGTKETAAYEQVSAGKTKHAEAVRITYDPTKISYAQLLQVMFTIFQPTALNFQGPDHGTQYRIAVFCESDEQKKVTEAYIKQLTDAKVFDQPIVVALEPIGAGFFPAEAYHQDYVVKNPRDPYVVQWALPKIEKVRTKFADLVKK